MKKIIYTLAFINTIYLFSIIFTDINIKLILSSLLIYLSLFLIYRKNK